MDALIESLPVTSSGSLYAYWNSGGIRCQNEMTTRHVAAAKAKGWAVRSYENNQMQDYVGIESTDVITFTQDQMATIILPIAPDASKGRYYRLDRCEDNRIIFEQELQPQARTPYIIVPNEDFSVTVKESELEGLDQDMVSIEGISFIGSYSCKQLECPEGFYIDIIDKTPDCGFSSDETFLIGALRAYLIVAWDDPYNPGGTRSPQEKKEIVLKDDPDGINEIQNGEMVNGKWSNGKCFDLSGRKIVNGKLPQGIYIQNGRKYIK